MGNNNTHDGHREQDRYSVTDWQVLNFDQGFPHSAKNAKNPYQIFESGETSLTASKRNRPKVVKTSSILDDTYNSKNFDAAFNTISLEDDDLEIGEVDFHRYLFEHTMFSFFKQYQSY